MRVDNSSTEHFMSGLLPPWTEASSVDRKSRWLPSYAAVQVDMPVALLASRASEAKFSQGQSATSEDNEPRTADGMAQNLVPPFLMYNVRPRWMAHRPERAVTVLRARESSVWGCDWSLRLYV